MIKTHILNGDITTAAVDVMVNAANSQLKRGGGVDGAIHQAAGPQLQIMLNTFSPIKPGELVITEGFNLNVKYIFHAVGPIWNKDHNAPELLRDTYMAIYKSMMKMKLKSVAIPNISTGVYGFPKQLAASIVYEATKSVESSNLIIYFYCFDLENYNLYSSLFNPLDTSN